MSVKPIICPSLLSCDLSMIANESIEILKLGADRLHIDVMDAHFVPNLTFGPPVIKKMRQHCDGFFDCHLMIENPEKWIKDYSDAGCDLINFHIEALEKPEDCERVLKYIHSLGKKAGVTVKPKTEIYPHLLELCVKGEVDQLLVMTVEPGFGGQKFMEDMLDKVRLVRKECPNLDIQVDGGVNLETIEACAKAGANVIVSGSGIYKTEDKAQTMKKMKEIMSKHF